MMTGLSLASLLQEIMEIVWNEKDIVTCRFSALDRRLLKKTKHFFEDQYGIESSYENPCGLFVHTSDHPTPEPPLCPSNVKLRSLTQKDAELVNSRWQYRSNSSLPVVREMVGSKRSIGLEVDGKLISWACQNLDGPMGMLWTEEEYRRKGYGDLVIAEMMKVGNENNRAQPWLAFIVDGNAASKSLFQKLKWERVADADWVGFTVNRQK